MQKNLLVICLAAILSAAAPYSVKERLDESLVHLLAQGLRTPRVRPWPRHHLLHHPEKRAQVAGALVDAGRAHDVSPWLLAATSYRESGFRNHVIGRRGERSGFQIMPWLVTHIRADEPRCNLHTFESAAYCAAYFLAQGKAVCRSRRGAVSYYVTGTQCRPRSPHVRWVVRDRIGLARSLERLNPPAQS